MTANYKVHLFFYGNFDMIDWKTAGFMFDGKQECSFLSQKELRLVHTVFFSALYV